jgi:hypothetical protein
MCCRPQLTIVDDVEDEDEEEIFGEDQELVRTTFSYRFCQELN